MGKALQRDLWIDWLIVASCGVEILVLGLSAVYDPSIRVLHVFQAAIYVAVVILARRRSPWGYGAGCFIAAFWNWTNPNLVHTTFIANGVRELLRTGHLTRDADQLIAVVVAASAHFILIAACLLGYARIRPKGAWAPLRFLGGGLLAIGYFGGIIVLFGPQYLPLLLRVLGI